MCYPFCCTRPRTLDEVPTTSRAAGQRQNHSKTVRIQSRHGQRTVRTESSVSPTAGTRPAPELPQVAKVDHHPHARLAANQALLAFFKDDAVSVVTVNQSKLFTSYINGQITLEQLLQYCELAQSQILGEKNAENFSRSFQKVDRRYASLPQLVAVKTAAQVSPADLNSSGLSAQQEQDDKPEETASTMEEFLATMQKNCSDFYWHNTRDFPTRLNLLMTVLSPEDMHITSRREDSSELFFALYNIIQSSPLMSEELRNIWQSLDNNPDRFIRFNTPQVADRLVSAAMLGAPETQGKLTVDEALTLWEACNRDSQRFANLLRELTIARPDRLALMVKNNHTLIAAVWQRYPYNNLERFFSSLSGKEIESAIENRQKLRYLMEQWSKRQPGITPIAFKSVSRQQSRRAQQHPPSPSPSSDFRSSRQSIVSFASTVAEMGHRPGNKSPSIRSLVSNYDFTPMLSPAMASPDFSPEQGRHWPLLAGNTYRRSLAEPGSPLNRPPEPRAAYSPELRYRLTNRQQRSAIRPKSWHQPPASFMATDL